jgi:death-on-curing protein
VEIKFLTLDQVMKLHAIQIEKFGGLHGVKNEGLLVSALAQPSAGFGEEYFHKSIYEMAAAYLFHLVKNHAFHDGNKRIAALASAVFLQINGLKVVADEDEFERVVMDAAQSLITKEIIAEFFKKSAAKF